jgi:hypothetical protein
MNDQLELVDNEIIIAFPEDASLDELIAGLEGSSPETVGPRSPAETPAPAIQRTAAAAVEAKNRHRPVRREPHEFNGEMRVAVAGFPMRLVNLSSTGLLAETSQRLCPGRTVDVFLRYGGVRKVLRATVIRSSMHAVAPSPLFRAALQFDNTLVLQGADL